MSELKARLAYFSEDDYDKGAHKICAKVSDCGYDRRNEWWSYAFEDEVYLKSEADKVLAEKDREIAMLKERICNGDVSRLTWIDDCIAKDKEIEELKKKLMPCLNGDCILTCEVVEKYGKENAELKAKLENVQASMYADVVDANMKIRRLQRALYKALANWDKCEERINNMDAYEASKYLPSAEDKFRKKAERWSEMERKCRAKAEEYK